MSLGTTCQGKPFHSRPSSSRPPDLGLGPPHCLKKKATPNWRHRSRSSVAQDGAIGTGLRAALAPDDRPRDPGQVDRADRSEQGLEGDEACGRADLPEVLDPSCVLGVLDGDAKPYVFGDCGIAVPVTDVAAHERASFREHLVDVPVCPFHRVENLVDERSFDLLVE